MSTPGFDPVEYKAAQQKEWSGAAAGWREWWEKLEQGLGRVSRRLVDLVELGPGEQVLDVATGIGEPAVTAARRVGPDGRVVATDIAPGMLEIGRERAAALGLANIEFREADAEELQVAEGAFDAVLSRCGLMFFPNVSGALGRIRTALRPGGRFAASVFGSPERTPFITIPLQAVAQELAVPPPVPGMPGPLALADADALSELMRSAGFDGVSIERETITVGFDSPSQYRGYVEAIAAPLQVVLAQHPHERQQQVWRTIEAAASAHAIDNGSVSLPAEVIYVFGRR